MAHQDAGRPISLDAGSIRLGAVEAGPGSGGIIVLIAGWPETLYAWRLVQPLLAAEGYRVIALDPPGIGRSDLLPPGTPADCGAMADLIVEGLKSIGVDRFFLVGHDVGTWLSYSIATRHSDLVERVCLTEAAIPGIAPAEAFGIRNAPRVFQFFLGATPDLPELLVEEREEAFFRYLFDTKTTVRDAISQADLEHYVEAYSAPGRMSAGFAYYRAAHVTAEQNEQSSAPSMPVLAIGGTGSLGGAVHDALERKGTQHLEGRVFAGVGHYLPEEAPEEFAGAVLSFISEAASSGK
ncbi:alpha/beta fold hydrolase [Sphingomonas sp. BK580]|uniref:alpha/beta fold hydrolase n=1 Tax=Sphingomonas sp. BK580 TaxID=2586972 RepID=UPI001607399F|nr:alpha/beta hydrolase [Sphingomonas sp. BK580]MBB3695224.1 pimeloyl-ACP methyl ester carboxylesterase [Sphingomonas sp. BK580]